jgi:hypothetical protein
MTNLISKEKAIILRKKGFSIGEISKKLNRPKTTISYWCRDILLTKKQEERIIKKSISAGIKSGLEISKKSKVKRDILNKKYKILGLNDLGKISKRDLFILGLGLYWGEGYKKGNYEFGFTNSDPEIIKIFIKWIKEFYKSKESDLILRVSINNIYTEKEKEIINFWLKITNTKLSQFTKTSFIKSKFKKDYSKNKKYYGTLRIKIRKGSNIKRRVMGSIITIPKSI